MWRQFPTHYMFSIKQRQSLGTMDDDDRSLVQSIHSYLLDTNFQDNLTETMDQDDPLLSCDSYINNKLSQAQQVGAQSIFL